MIIDSTARDESGAFKVGFAKFRFNDVIVSRITDYLKKGGAVFYPLNVTFPEDKQFEEFTLKEMEIFTMMHTTLDAISAPLTKLHLWHAQVAFGTAGKTVCIDKLGWIVQFDPGRMSEAAFIEAIKVIAENNNCRFALVNMPSARDICPEMIQEIVGVRCLWGMFSNHKAHLTYKNILSNYYN